MKTFSIKKRRAVPAVRKARSYVHHPLGPVQLAQQAEIRRILRSTGAQAKLSIGQPNNKYEQEADRVADQVMAMAPPPTPDHLSQNNNKPAQDITKAAQTISQIQPKTGPLPQVSAVNPQIPQNITAMQGGGQPLPSGIRQFFEPRFGADFSGVRVHTDPRATDTAHLIHARAFTIGRDIAFGAGEYSNEGVVGKKLLAHELTHVVQSAGGSTKHATLHRKPTRGSEERRVARIAVRWADDSTEFFHRIVEATARAAAFRDVGEAPLWQGFFGPAHRLHSAQGLERRSGDRVLLEVSAWYDPDTSIVAQGVQIVVAIEKPRRASEVPEPNDKAVVKTPTIAPTQKPSKRTEIESQGVLETTPTPAQITHISEVEKVLDKLKQAMVLARQIPPNVSAAREKTTEVADWIEKLVTEKNIRAHFLGFHFLDPHFFYSNADILCKVAKYESRNLERYLKRCELWGRPVSQGLFNVYMRKVMVAKKQLLHLNDEFVSFELAEAQSLPDAPTKIPNLSPLLRRVHAWLRKYQGVIVAAESRFGIDRRAIAGAIAWEATQNIRSGSPRSVGPGKVHLWEPPFKDVAAVEVEKLGQLPKRTYEERKKILSTPQGSITYIAAIMAEGALAAANNGFNIACDPAVLTNVYAAWDLSEWRKTMEEKAKEGSAYPKIGAPMAIWVRDNLAFLNDAVGVSRCSRIKNFGVRS